MHDAMLRAYERELKYFREASLDFAAAHPAIGRHLGLEADAAVDPFVERLIEGAAFLAARVQLRLDRSVDHFAEYLLDQLLPSANAPIPSTAMVQLDPGPLAANITAPLPVPRGTTLRLVSNAARSKPLFLHTAHGTTVRPMTVDRVDLIDGAAAVRAAIPDFCDERAGGSVRTTWKIEPSARANSQSIDELDLYLAGAGHAPYRVLAMLLAGARSVVAVAVNKTQRRTLGVWPAAQVLRLRALDDDSALLAESEPGLYAGFRLIEEFFVLPERFRQLALRLDITVPPAEALELHFVVDRIERQAAVDFEQVRFVPCCVPVVNLFPRRLDRAGLDGGRGEVRLVVDRTRATDYEIVRVTGGEAYVDGRARGEPLLPLHAPPAHVSGRESGARYSVQREFAQAADKDADASQVYRASEVWMTLVGGQGPDVSAYSHVAAQALVSNRERCHEAVRSAGGYTLSLEDPLPVESASFLVTPTPPEPAATGHASPWQLLGALRLNFFSLFGEDATAGAGRLRDVLGLLADSRNRFAGSILAGLVGMHVASTVERIPGSGPLAFARGARITLDVDQNLADSGLYIVLGALLDRFLAGYASVNSFTQLALRDTRRHVLHVWPVRMGLHECL